jgi:hypothetical protein
MWSHDFETNLPKMCIKSVDCLFNRAIIFNTTQHSWHGFPNAITAPAGMCRKSIAVYYLSELSEDTDTRERVLYAPTVEQQNDPSIQELIKERSRW